MKNLALILGIMVASSCFASQKMLIDCDFTGMKGHHFNRICGRIANGRPSLFKETDGNLCGQWTVDTIRKDKKGNDYVNCDVFIGMNDRKTTVSALQPGKTYSFAVKLKGSKKGLPVSIRYLYWVGENFWKDLKTAKSLVRTSTESTWVEHRGTFRVPADARKLAMQLQMWGNSAYGPLKYSAGDYILFDDVKVWETSEAAKEN